jgi:hypothetical protein
MFDATSTSAPSGINAFHGLTYEFDFGDNRGLNWAHSGRSKNTEVGGPLAAHVYDNPGTYTVRVRSRTAAGGYSDTTLTITVQNPSDVFSGQNTLCVSTMADYTGCPTGAARVTGLPSSYAGKRVLLRRGESFPTINIDRRDDQVIVGAYGSGAKPRVPSVNINTGQMGTNFADEITIMDLEVTSGGIYHSDSGSRYLIYRNDLVSPSGNNRIEIGGALDFYASRNPSIPYYFPREIFIVENNVLGRVNNTQSPFMNLVGLGSRFAVLGNDASRAEQHTSRFFALHKSVISHNALRGQAYSGTGASIRHAMKIHSSGLSAYNDLWHTSNRWATSQVIVADNIFGDPADNSSWTAAAGPQNRDAGTDEGIEDMIIERNNFFRGPYTNTEMYLVGRRITARGNTRADGGRPNLSIGSPSVTMPAEWHGPYYLQ